MSDDEQWAARKVIYTHAAHDVVERIEACWSADKRTSTLRAGLIVKALFDAGLLVDAELVSGMVCAVRK